MKKYLILATIILTTGCVSPYKATVDDYLFAYENVVLGMSVKEVKEILEQRGKFPVKVSWGLNYHEMKDITEKFV